MDIEPGWIVQRMKDGAMFEFSLCDLHADLRSKVLQLLFNDELWQAIARYTPFLFSRTVGDCKEKVRIAVPKDVDVRRWLSRPSFIMLVAFIVYLEHSEQHLKVLVDKLVNSEFVIGVLADDASEEPFSVRFDLLCRLINLYNTLGTKSGRPPRLSTLNQFKFHDISIVKLANSPFACIIQYFPEDFWKSPESPAEEEASETLTAPLFYESAQPNVTAWGFVQSQTEAEPEAEPDPEPVPEPEAEPEVRVDLSFHDHNDDSPLQEEESSNGGLLDTLLDSFDNLQSSLVTPQPIAAPAAPSTSTFFDLFDSVPAVRSWSASALLLDVCATESIELPSVPSRRAATSTAELQLVRESSVVTIPSSSSPVPFAALSPKKRKPAVLQSPPSSSLASFLVPSPVRAAPAASSHAADDDAAALKRARLAAFLNRVTSPSKRSLL